MASGPEHYREAEALLRRADALSPSAAEQDAPILLQQAQVHATLALAAATALDPCGADRANPNATADPDAVAWWNVAAVQPAVE
jgi:hypothetical protein